MFNPKNMKNMEQNFNNNRGNGYNGQNRNNVNNNNQGAMNHPEVVNTCAQSGKSTFNTVAQHLSENKTAYGVGVGVVIALAGLGFFAHKKGWISRKKKEAKEDPTPAAPAAAAEPTKPTKEAAGESK